MTSQADYYAEEIDRLRDEQRRSIEFSTTVSINLEKLTNNQQQLSKRLDELNEKMASTFYHSDKRIKSLEVSEIQRSERKKTISSLTKFWPLLAGLAILFFVIGHTVTDSEILKLIVKKWL
jgi:hypothetical protein